MFIPIHEGCEETVVLNGPQSGTQDGIQGGTQGDPQDVPQSELDNWIEEQIRKNAHITTEELAIMSGKGVRTIKRRISKLPHVKYVGSGYSGHWEVIDVN